MRSMVLAVFFWFFCGASENSLALYQKQAFDCALGSYSKNESKTASDWYMMGNAAFYNRNYEHALVFWHQSVLIGDSFYAQYALDNSNQARAALELEKANDLPVLYPFFIGELGIWFTWVLFFSLFLWVIVFVFKFYYQMKSAFVRLFLLLGSVVLCFLVESKLRLNHQAYSGLIISKIPAVVRVGPSSNYHEIEQIAPGALVIVLSESSGWYKMYYKKSFGWIASADLLTARSAAQSYAASATLE